jgi:hypothetical protein
MPYPALVGSHMFSESFLGDIMIRLCSSNIVKEIFGVGFVGSLVIGVRDFGFYLWDMAFYSIWDVYVL